MPEFTDARRVWRCKKESEQQSTAKMMKMPHSMKMKQSTAKMPQDQQSRSTNRSNGSTMEVYAPTHKMKRRKTSMYCENMKSSCLKNSLKIPSW